MMTSPFKFLDSYTREDRAIFFGREKEIDELYRKVFESKILLVYGISGTGKSSLIDCGLANKFQESDWLPISVRRGGNVVESLAAAVKQTALSALNFPVDTPKQFLKAIRSIYLDHYKPIYFIFDQFEELFIFGSTEERKSLAQLIKSIIESDLQCRFIISMREEYLAGITEFEKVIPSFYANRMRIEKMSLLNAVQAIEGPCKVQNIQLEEGFANALLERLSPESTEVELTFLQVALDRLYRGAVAEDERSQKSEVRLHFTRDLLKVIGNVSDLLGSFLDEQITQLEDPDSALAVLKSFVSVKGTKRQMTSGEVQDYARTLGKPIDEATLQQLLQTFIHLRILRDKDQNNRYELRHDALAAKIYEKITLVEKELLEIRQLIENAYNAWEKRGVLLNKHDLEYIDLYKTRLYLQPNFESFILKSRNTIRRRLIRIRSIILSGSIFLFLVLGGLSFWALNERNNALLSQLKAQSAERDKSDIAALLKKKNDVVMSISPIKQNVVYLGMENIMQIVVSGIPANNVGLSCSTGKLMRLDSTGGYSLFPLKEGEVTMQGFAQIGNTKMDLGTRTFRVRHIPDPSIYILGNRNMIQFSHISEIEEVQLLVDGSDYDVSYSVDKFSVVFVSKGKITSFRNENSSFTQEEKVYLKQLNLGDYLILKDFKAVSSDGRIIGITNQVFEVK
jgi:hypothetical protein